MSYCLVTMKKLTLLQELQGRRKTELYVSLPALFVGSKVLLQRQHTTHWLLPPSWSHPFWSLCAMSQTLAQPQHPGEVASVGLSSVQCKEPATLMSTSAVLTSDNHLLLHRCCPEFGFAKLINSSF